MWLDCLSECSAIVTHSIKICCVWPGQRSASAKWMIIFTWIGVDVGLRHETSISINNIFEQYVMLFYAATIKVHLISLLKVVTKPDKKVTVKIFWTKLRTKSLLEKWEICGGDLLPKTLKILIILVSPNWYGIQPWGVQYTQDLDFIGPVVNK